MKMLTCERFLLISRERKYLVFSVQTVPVRGSVGEFDLREMNVLKTQSLLKDILAFSLILGQDYFCLHLLLWGVIWNGKFRQQILNGEYEN